MEKIKACERKYIECFSKATKHHDFIRFCDEMIPDMHYHNFTRIESNNNSPLIEIIEREISHSRNLNKVFCLIRCHVPVNESVLALLSHKPEVSISGYYLFDLSFLPNLNSVANCSIRKVNKVEMLEDLLHLDLLHDGKSLGKDFCTRRIYRRKNVYLSDEGVNSYICYAGGEAVGNCDLFIFEDTAKIEDFAVAPLKQRKGYGTAMLRAMIEIALKKNATTIYLETDVDGTAKEMYEKCGFSKIYEFTDLHFTL